PVGGSELASRGNAALLFPADAEVTADDRLDSGFGSVLGEFQSAEQVVAVGDGDRRHCLLLGERHDPVGLVRALSERIGGTGFEMDESGDGHAALSPSILWKVRQRARRL